MVVVRFFNAVTRVIYPAMKAYVPGYIVDEGRFVLYPAVAKDGPHLC